MIIILQEIEFQEMKLQGSEAKYGLIFKTFF